MKTTTRRIRGTLGALMFGTVMLLPLSACEKKGPLEKIGEDIDDAIDDVKDEIEDATDEVQDEVQDDVNDAGDSDS